MERRYIMFCCIVTGIVTQNASRININGTFPYIRINCEAPVVGYRCTVACYVRDFNQPITIFCPLNIPVGSCSPKVGCKKKDGYTIQKNHEKKVIYLGIPSLNANHSGKWICTYGGGATSKPANFQAYDLPIERSPSIYLTPYEGESISLHCDFDYRDGCYDTKWYKDGNELKRNDTGFKMDSPFLVIPKITQKQKGVYMCSVTSSDINISNGSKIIINSVRKEPKEANCPKEIPPTSPCPTQHHNSDSGQGFSQISPLWNMLVWILVLLIKFGFWFIFLWIFGFSQFYCIAISLFREEETVLIRLCRWIVVLVPVLILIMTPRSITALEDLGVFLLSLATYIITAFLSCFIFKQVLEAHDRPQGSQRGEPLLETNQNPIAYS